MCRTPESVQAPGEEVRWRVHSNDEVIVRWSFLSSVRGVRALAFQAQASAIAASSSPAYA